MRTIREVLLAAADHIEKVGLHKRQYYGSGYPEGRSLDEDPLPTNQRPCCSYGAIGAVLGVSPASGIVDGCAEWLGDSLGVTSVVVWNDDPARTQEEVVTAFRRAAEQPCALNPVVSVIPHWKESL